MVTRWLPRTCNNAFRIASRVTPASLSSLRGRAARPRPVGFGQRDQQMLGADIVVAHLFGFGFGLVRHRADFARQPDFADIAADLGFGLHGCENLFLNIGRLRADCAQDAAARCRRPGSATHTASVRVRSASCRALARLICALNSDSWAFSVYWFRFMAKSVRGIRSLLKLRHCD